MCDLEQYPQIGSHNIIIVCIILHILSPVLYVYCFGMNLLVINKVDFESNIWLPSLDRVERVSKNIQ